MSESPTLLIGIGAQKAGTTWIARYLDDHPEVFMSPIKELHFFDARHRPDLHGQFDNMFVERLDSEVMSYVKKRTRESYERFLASNYRVRMIGERVYYTRLFEELRGSRKVCCEITPSYATLSEDAFTEMRKLFPRVKILFIMRNPVDRIWSSIRHEARLGGQTPMADAMCKALNTPGTWLRSDYGRTLTQLKEAFPPEDIHIDFYENLFQPQGVYRLCDFLNISRRPANVEVRVNQSAPAELDDTARKPVFQALRHNYVHIANSYPKSIPQNWLDDMTRLDRL
jgi:hypothetical protein